MRPQPVYLNLFTFKFPVTAYASVLHRLTGVILFVLIPYFLTLLHKIYTYNPRVMSYSPMQLGSYWILFIWWLGLSALVYHLLAGIRHMIMDSGYGESFQVARISSYAVIISSVLISIVIGIRLC
jgi:succinate dehydrogenase / fumarate reductase cytochrome b subunit